jgi:hypothetical protein
VLGSFRPQFRRVHRWLDPSDGSVPRG